jgi:hypothetical protein
LWAVIENSHAPVNNARVQKHMALVTPFSVNCATHYNHCSTTSAKKLLKQAIANVSKEKITLIPELPTIVLCVMGGKQNTDNESNNKCEDADINPATDQMDINSANEVAVEFQARTFLGDVVRPASMFGMDKIIDDFNNICAAKHLC